MTSSKNVFMKWFFDKKAAKCRIGDALDMNVFKIFFPRFFARKLQLCARKDKRWFFFLSNSLLKLTKKIILQDYYH